jgi:zinc/manganese transport system substrate-binding protein
MTSRALSLFALVPVGLLLAGCASAPSEDADAGLSIVASTNVWGDIAQSVAGGGVNVTSIIDSAAKDPHSYEATTRDQLAISRADLVLVNGGGYDASLETLIDAAGSEAPVIEAVEASGLAEGAEEHEEEEHEAEVSGADADEHADEHGHIEGLNEHVWYSLAAVEHVAQAVADELSEIDPGNEGDYRANADAFSGRIHELEADADAMRTAAAGRGVAITEPVPLYLLEEVGLENLTPDEFSEAIEEGTDVAPATLLDTLAVLDDPSLALLAYNSQTAGTETERVREAAEDAGVPVVEFTETLPDGSDYVSWMTDNLDAIRAAL